jgi:NAD(P)-dependent dehydrogenase (short-subunit alcohol dehydrogenase family)
MAEAVVTGAASGIGRALARQLAASGNKVYLADTAPLDDAVAATGGVAVPTDVSRPDQVLQLAKIAREADLVCLNAGIVGPSVGAPWDVPTDEWMRVLHVNLLGVINGLHAFVPVLRSKDHPTRLLITASLAGLVTFPGGGAYAATKHAVVAVAEQTAMLLADSSVGVTLLCPALVKTGMSDSGQEPEAVARFALEACRRRQFLVYPPEWRGAIESRGALLSTGQPPIMPATGS